MVAVDPDEMKLAVRPPAGIDNHGNGGRKIVVNSCRKENTTVGIDGNWRWNIVSKKEVFTNGS